MEQSRLNPMPIAYGITPYILLSINIIVIIITFQFSIESLSLLAAFDNDSEAAVVNLLQNLDEGNFSPHGFYNYGYLYQSTAILILKVLSLLGFKVRDVQVVCNSFLLINIISYLGTFLLIKKILTKLKISLWNKFLSELFYINLPAVVYWTGRIHPDMLLGFLSFLSFYFFLKYTTGDDKKLVNLLFGIFILGVAFGAKYSALMFAPVYAVYIVYETVRSHENWFNKLLVRGNLAILTFLLGWLLFNPYVVLDLGGFIEDFTAELHHVSYGGGVTDGIASERNPLLWIPVLQGELTVLGLFFFALGIIAIFFSLFKKSNLIKKDIASLVLMLFLFPLAYTIFGVVDRVPRYLIHLFPFGILVVSLGLNHLEESLGSWINQLKIQAKVINVFAVIAVLFCGLQLFIRMPYGGLLERQNWKTSQRVKDGQWIDRYLYEKINIRLLTGQYSYLPDWLAPGVTTTWYFNDIDLELFNVVVLNNIHPGKFVWKNNNTSFKDGKFTTTNLGNFQSSLEFYKKLINDNNWEVKYETKETIFLTRKNLLDEQKLLVGFEEIASWSDFHIYYEPNTKELILKKAEQSSDDFVNSFLIETIIKEDGIEKRIDVGLNWYDYDLISYNSNAYLKYHLPEGDINYVRIGQYYLKDGTYYYPWVLRIGEDAFK